MIRAGVGRFYDKTHFEVIGGLYTGTPFTTSFIVNFPTAAADNGPRNGQLPTDPFLVNGPVLNRTLLNQLYPGGQLLRNTGATWDNPDRIVPRSDEISIGYERQLGAVLSASVDYLHSRGRDLFVQLNHNPQVRTNPVVAQSTLMRVPSPELVTATQQLAQKYPGFTPFTTNVIQFVNEGETRLQRADGAVEEALQQQLQPAGVVHAGEGDRQRRRQRRAVEQLPGRQRPQPRSATKDRRTSTTATTSRSAARR